MVLDAHDIGGERGGKLPQKQTIAQRTEAQKPDSIEAELERLTEKRSRDSEQRGIEEDWSESSRRDRRRNFHYRRAQCL